MPFRVLASANDPKRTSVPVIRANKRRGAHASTTIVISNVPHSKVAKDQATVEAGMRRAGKKFTKSAKTWVFSSCHGGDGRHGEHFGRSCR